MTDVTRCLSRIDTGVIVIDNVITTNHCTVLAEINGCQVLKWFKGNICTLIAHILQFPSVTGG